jgi:competence protein ComEA
LTWRDRVLAAIDAIRSAAPAAWVVGATAIVVAGVAAFIVTGRSSASPGSVVRLPRADTVTTSSGGPGTTNDEVMIVHAAGAVVRPGVYRMPSGARVNDVVIAAGGPAPDADLDQLDLAAKVGDGDRVYVPRRGEGGTIVGSTGLGGASSGPTGPVDLNRATVEQLDALPGVGPSTARAIVEWRTRHGRFRSVRDLLDVPGIGPSKFEHLQSLVVVR